eukprot:8204094-Ditylum_brightwellii.AAC.1
MSLTRFFKTSLLPQADSALLSNYCSFLLCIVGTSNYAAFKQHLFDLGGFPDSSSLAPNKDNFGYNNVRGNGTCSIIFDEGSRLCLPFEADSCLLPDVTFTAMASVASSQVPSAFNMTASLALSVAQSHVPSVVTSSVPSNMSSSVQSEMPSISYFRKYVLLAEAVAESGSNSRCGVLTI